MFSACRTAFNWAARRRMLPPFADNPFALFKLDLLRDPRGSAGKPRMFTAEQERAFFAACNDWQRPLFATLATYGLRLGELTHLLVEDVDFGEDVFTVRSKPWMFWSVKTGRDRTLPLLPATRAALERAVGGRKAGFVFLNAGFASGRKSPAASPATPQAFRARVERAVADLMAASPGAGEREQRRAAVTFCRSLSTTPLDDRIFARDSAI